MVEVIGGKADPARKQLGGAGLERRPLVAFGFERAGEVGDLARSGQRERGGGLVVSADDEAPDSTGFKSAGSTGKHECPWLGLELLCEGNTRKQ